MKASDLLIVVDAQNDFLSPEGKLFIGHDTTDYRKKLGEFVNNFPGYVIATKDTHFGGAAEFERFPEHCIIYTRGWRIIDEINSEKINRSLAKNSFNAQGISLHVTGLLYGDLKTWEELKITPESTIYVVGVCTSICVHDIITGIVNEAKNNYNINPKIVIIKDLVDDFDKEMAEFSLKRLQKFYGVEIK